MSDVLEPPNQEEPEGEAIDFGARVNDAFEQIQVAIEGLLSVLGETDDSLLTDWIVVAISQGMDEGGYPTCSNAIVLPKRFTPGYRVKGLLMDAIDQLHAAERQPVIVMQAGEDDE